MKSKEKIVKIVILFWVISILFIGLYIYYKIEYNSYANYNTEKNETKISSAEKIDLDEIINNNSTVLGYKEELEIKKEELEYITKYRKNPNLYKGETKVFQEGENGEQAITIKRVYNEKNELIKEEQVSAVVVIPSKNKIIDIGSKKRDSVRVLNSGKKVIDFNIQLNKPSGFSLEQFKKALTDYSDKNKIFEENAEYFYYVEKEYNINGIFVAAVGIHESAWGTSKIAVNKHNLFGYGAYDSNPYNGAYSFSGYAESIDLVSRVFVKYYLNESGTKIYGNEIARGTYYNGSTISAVNKKYATDKNWANCVYKYMNYLYNKIN